MNPRESEGCHTCEGALGHLFGRRWLLPIKGVQGRAKGGARGGSQKASICYPNSPLRGYQIDLFWEPPNLYSVEGHPSSDPYPGPVEGLSQPSVAKLRRGIADDKNFTPPGSGRPRGAAQDAGLLAHRFLGTLARCFAAENGNEPGEQIGGLIAEELIAEDDPEVAGLVASWLTMLAETVWVRVRDAYPEQADVHGL